MFVSNVLEQIEDLLGRPVDSAMNISTMMSHFDYLSLVDDVSAILGVKPDSEKIIEAATFEDVALAFIK